jgi:hypothetical protein
MHINTLNEGRAPSSWFGRVIAKTSIGLSLGTATRALFAEEHTCDTPDSTYHPVMTQTRPLPGTYQCGVCGQHWQCKP